MERRLLQKAMQMAAQLLQEGRKMQTESKQHSESSPLLRQFDRPTLSTQAFSIDLVRALSWNRFEALCGAYFAAHGFRAEQKSHGSDGGVDIRLYFKSMPQPVKLIQCKGWRKKRIDVDLVRALMGVMAREQVPEGIFLTMSTFSKPAREEAAANRIMLIDGNAFVERLETLDADRKASLLQVACEGEYWRPLCARCGVPMNPVKTVERPFWGCPNYAKRRCTSKIELLSEASS